MDYKHAAQQVLDAIGGASNIVSAAHCATRLRLVIADNDKVDKKALENAEGSPYFSVARHPAAECCCISVPSLCTLTFVSFQFSFGL